MITVFNRKELLITYDMQKQANVRTILSNHKIPCVIKTFNRASLMRLGMRYYGPMGMTENAQIEYKIYVNKKDYEKAYILVNGKFR